MKTGAIGTGRRTLLQRGVALVVGGVAVVSGTRWVRADPVPRGSGFSVFARKGPVAWNSAGSDTRVTTSGELFDRPGGTAIGAFHSNCFCANTPFGPQTASASSLEFEVLQLPEGTLFAMSSGGTGHMTPRAIIGGTDRFAGAHGSYIERPLPTNPHGVVELIVTLAS